MKFLHSLLEFVILVGYLASLLAIVIIGAGGTITIFVGDLPLWMTTKALPICITFCLLFLKPFMDIYMEIKKKE